MKNKDQKQQFLHAFFFFLWNCVPFLTISEEESPETLVNLLIKDKHLCPTYGTKAQCDEERPNTKDCLHSSCCWRMPVGVFTGSRGAEASTMGRKQRLMEISLFVKDDGKKHLVTITEARAYLKPLLKDGRKRTWLMVRIWAERP